MARAKPNTQSKQEAPIQFRPGPELKRRLAQLVENHNLSAVEACKDLIALALCGMDSRYYPIVAQMAAAMGGPQCFVPCCLHVSNAMLGAERVGDKLDEIARAAFVVRTVADYLSACGQELDATCLWFDPAVDAGALPKVSNPTQGQVAGTRTEQLPRVRRIKARHKSAQQKNPEGVPEYELGELGETAAEPEHREKVREHG